MYITFLIAHFNTDTILLYRFLGRLQVSIVLRIIIDSKKSLTCSSGTDLQILNFCGRTYIALPTVRPMYKRKRTKPKLGSLCSRYLSSRAVTRQVLSAYMSLTSVFGMGRGGPSRQSTRTMCGFYHFFSGSLVTHTGFEPMLTA